MEYKPQKYFNLNYRYLVRNTFIFILTYLIFFYYHDTAVYDSTVVLYLVNSLVFIVFLVSVYRIDIGLYLFIFFIPLLNSLTTIFGVRPVSTLLYLFFALFLGFLVNNFTKVNSTLLSQVTVKEFKASFDPELAKPIIFFIIIFSISALLTIFRYSNFFPFITNRFINLKVNVKGIDSISAMFWVLRFFFNYIAGFGLVYLIYNSVKKIRVIKISILVLVGSTILSSFFVLYQYFVNPFIGSFKYWVDSGRLNSTFTDPNSMGAYTVIIFPIFLSLIIYFKRWYLKSLFIVLTLLFLPMIYFAGSRTTVITVFLSALAFLALGIYIFSTHFTGLNKKRKIAAIIAIILIAIILISFIGIIAYLGFSKDQRIMQAGLLSRTGETLRTMVDYLRKAGFVEAIKSISNYRYIYWDKAMEMTSDYPVAGIGLGTYIIEVADYLYRTADFVTIDFVGNYYLQILAELGLPALISVLIIFILLIKKTGILFRKSGSIRRGIPPQNWIFIGLFISFLSMLFALILGAHTNFLEIQFTFWLIIGLMMVFIRLNTGKYINDLNAVLEGDYPGSREGIFSKIQKAGIAVIVLIFAVSFISASLTTLSIAGKQNSSYWSNEYGFYQVERAGDREFRWLNKNASTVLGREGSYLNFSVQDGNLSEDDKPNKVRFFIDNLQVGSVNLGDDSWYNVKLEIPEYAQERITLTIVSSRSWVPKELGLSSDTRELAIKIGAITFTDGN